MTLCQRMPPYLVGKDAAELKLSLGMAACLDPDRLICNQADGTDGSKRQNEETQEHKGTALRGEDSRSWPAT